VLKLSKEPEFLAGCCPAVNRVTAPDKQHNDNPSTYKGSFAAYKEELDSPAGSGVKYNVEHVVDRFFLLDYTGAGYITGTAGSTKINRYDATSTYDEIYPLGDTAAENAKKIRHEYTTSGVPSSTSRGWWVMSPTTTNSGQFSRVDSSGTGNNIRAATTLNIMCLPMCVLY